MRKNSVRVYAAKGPRLKKNKERRKWVGVKGKGGKTGSVRTLPRNCSASDLELIPVDLS